MLKKNFFRAILLVLFLFSQSFDAHAGEIERILSLVDYIGGDYPNAVSDGRVINEFEYREISDFSSVVVDLWEKAGDKRGEAWAFSEKFASLQTLVASRSPVSEVKNLADELKREIISVYGLKPYPGKPPDYESGKSVYAASCSSCHGVSGKGDGLLSENLSPPATDFTDGDVKSGLSPFKVYNTVTFGIEGTAMLSFDDQLGEEKKWDVAFYVLSLGYPDDDPAKMSLGASPPEVPQAARGLENLSALSNSELLAAAGVTDELADSVLYNLRTVYLRNAESEVLSDAVAHTIHKIGVALDLYESGKREEAVKEIIDGYLDGFQKAEPALLARNKGLVYEIERELGVFRSGMNAGMEVSELRALGDSVEKNLRDARSALSEGSTLGKWVSFANSFSIILRESLEALLIIAAIIAFLVHSGSGSMVRYVHYGWLSAIVAGIATWLAARTLIEISGARREIVEGVTSLLAAAVLFYVSYWLVSKADVKQWKEYVKQKTQSALGGKNGFALVVVSFLAVYREAFETLLFYQALLYQADSSVPHVIYGFAAGVVAVVLVAFLMYRFTMRIPLRYFFSFTSVFLYLLCFILLGKGVTELQEAGVVSSTYASFLPYIDVLGVYPTYETVVPQGLLILAAAALVMNVFASARRRKGSAAGSPG